MERYGWVADKVHRRKMAREAARGVLPNSTETKIVVTANARAWRTMLELRSSEGAELEIRRMAVAVLRLLQQEAPGFFSDFEIYVGGGSARSGADRLPQSLNDRLERKSLRADDAIVLDRATDRIAFARKIIARKSSSYLRATWHFTCAHERDRATHSRSRALTAHRRDDQRRDGMTRIGFAYNQKPEHQRSTQPSYASERSRQ